MPDRDTLKSYFQTGDVPSAGNFSDLIDSFKLADDAEPWYLPVHLGVAASVASTTWQDIGQVLVPKPPAEWQLDLNALAGGSKDFELQVLNNKGTVIYFLDFTAQPLEIFTFSPLDVAALQDHGAYIHLTLQARLQVPSSGGDLDLPQIIFHAHP